MLPVNRRRGTSRDPLAFKNKMQASQSGSKFCDAAEPLSNGALKTPVLGRCDHMNGRLLPRKGDGVPQAKMASSSVLLWPYIYSETISGGPMVVCTSQLWFQFSCLCQLRPPKRATSVEVA